MSIKSLPRDKTSVFKDYHGILSIIRIDNMNTFTMPIHDLTDRFFKIQRKKFIIEKMHLPPDLSETVSRTTPSCGTSNGAMDF